MLSRVGSRNFLLMLPILALGLAIMIMAVQLVFKLPPLTISTSERTRQFTSSSGHFVISYPAQWSLTDLPKGAQGDSAIVALIDDPKVPLPGASVIIRESTVTYQSLDEVERWGEDILQKERDYARGSIQRFKISGEDTLLEEFTTEIAPGPLVGNPTMRCIANYRLYGRVGYILTFCAGVGDFPNVEPIFRQMITSFRYQG